MLMPVHQVAFGKLQGLELMIRMMREHVFSSPLALRLADHAVRHCAANCEIFVDKLGLKVIFAMFMKKGPRQKAKAAQRESEEHVLSIIQSLCRYCSGTAVARVLNKFTECRFEKLERLLEIHEEMAEAVRRADHARAQGQMQAIDREFEVDEEEQLFLDRCDAGLFTLQQADLILVRLANMGNREATEEIGKLMDAKGVPLSEVVETIAEYCTHLDDSAEEERSEIQAFLKNLARRCGGDEAVKALEAVPGAASCATARSRVSEKRPLETPEADSVNAEREREEQRRTVPRKDDSSRDLEKDERKDKKQKKEKSRRG